MITEDLPLWAALPAAILLICGGTFALIGAVGLLRLPTFYMRMHAPSMGNTLGAGCVLLASIVVSSAVAGRLVIHEVLITVFMVLTAPVSAMLIMRGAIYRMGVNAERQRQKSEEP
ncbi:MAG: monovalent cation/H(+) antiporter subunit G [Povalibacter sp.]